MASPDPVASAVRAAVVAAGMRPAASVSRLPVGMSNAVFEVSMADGGRVVARVASVAKNRYAMERVVMARAAGAGIVCPEVYAVEEVGELAVMLIEHIPGTRLGEASEGSEMAEACGEVLALIHSIPAVGAGNLTAAGEGGSDSLERWFVDDFETSFLQAAGAAEGTVRSRVEQIWSIFDAARPALRASDCHLVHGDFSPSNILVQDGRLAGVVDWESAKAGPAAFDFGWWDWFEAAFDVPFSTDDLVAAYAEHRAVDIDALREVRRLVVFRILIGQVAWTASRGQKPELGVALARLMEVAV